jgi:hypothetical protein
MSAQAEQLTQYMSAHTLSHLLAAKPLALVQEFFDPREDRRGLFFSGDGGASDRCRISVERSCNVQLTTSPFEKSII